MEVTTKRTTKRKRCSAKISDSPFKGIMTRMDGHPNKVAAICAWKHILFRNEFKLLMYPYDKDNDFVHENDGMRDYVIDLLDEVGYNDKSLTNSEKLSILVTLINQMDDNTGKELFKEGRAVEFDAATDRVTYEVIGWVHFHCRIHDILNRFYLPGMKARVVGEAQRKAVRELWK